jgi:alkanesulfonate monooxygenase SsuD/methylene tetrahydromethanopterin reductase-like flavin-dependent oxidoreductase (luciferase family)
VLSGGRLTVAVGAGFPNRSEVEYAISEVPWARRFARLDETVALWRQLWTGAGGAFDGELLSYADLPEGLETVRPGGPPVWLGGFTPAAFVRTGSRYDGWLPYPPDPADYAAGLLAVRDAAAAAGRPPDAVTPALFATVLLTGDGSGDRAAGAAGEAAFTAAGYGKPPAVVRSIQAFAVGTPAEVVARLRTYTDAGARHLLIRIAAVDPVEAGDQLSRLAALLPELR